MRSQLLAIEIAFLFFIVLGCGGYREVVMVYLPLNPLKGTCFMFFQSPFWGISG
jgi:hypothetical protein